LGGRITVSQQTQILKTIRPIYTDPLQNLQLEIKILLLNWIKHEDDATDLCAHGSIYVRIADKVIVDEKDGDGWTLSAAALNFMRTLERDYNPGDFAGQLIPCCGFFLIADDGGDHVKICGCFSGFDWKIQHDGNLVSHIVDTKQQAVIDIKDYQKIVLSFADQVQNFYKDSMPKTLPADDFDRKGYEAFWREWESLRNKWA
jgi:hypothetical protein